MNTHDNANDNQPEETFQPLTIALAKILERLETEQENEKQQQERAEFQRLYVEQRLREIAIWERRINKI